MVRGDTVGALGASLLPLLTLELRAAAVSSTELCSVTVAPAAAPAGTAFAFSGTEVAPSRQELTKDDRPAGSHTIVVGDMQASARKAG